MSSKKQSKLVPLFALREKCGKKEGKYWEYEPPQLKPRGTPKQSEALAGLLDNRAMHDLEAGLRDVIQQMLARAYAGDFTALRRFARIVCGAIEALDRLTDFQQDATKAVAETFSTWPVLLSLNPQQVEHSKQKLKTLGVGTKAPAPTRAGQRIDPHNFWTRLAAETFAVIRSNRRLVPLLKKQTRGALKQRVCKNLWAQKLGATKYTRTDGQIIVIPDWCGDTCNLSEPVTNANLAAWQKVVKLCVMDYWRMYPGEYQKALGQIGQPREIESRRRHFALDRIKQAFRSLLQ